MELVLFTISNHNPLCPRLFSHLDTILEEPRSLNAPYRILHDGHDFHPSDILRGYRRDKEVVVETGDEDIRLQSPQCDAKFRSRT